MRRKDGRPTIYTHARYWSEAEHTRARLLVEEGASVPTMARALGRSETAIEVWMKRHVKRRQVRPYTARGVALALGIPSRKTITWWISRGWLAEVRGHGLGAGKSARHFVRHDQLVAFLKDPRYWHLWDPSKVADRRLRAVVRLYREDGERFLTTGEVGDRLGVKHSTVTDWIRCGELPAVRRGNWLVRERDLKFFVPPCERSKVGMRHRP